MKDLSKPVRVGIPSNNRVSQDSGLINQYLGLEQQLDGSLKSRYIPGTLFYPLRVRTIAQYIKGRILDFGILGDDIAMDEGLDFPVYNARFFDDGDYPDSPPSQEEWEKSICNGDRNFCTKEQKVPIPSESEILLRPGTADAIPLYPERKCFSFEKLPTASLTLLRRKEEPERKVPLEKNTRRKTLITSYPRVAGKVLSWKDFDRVVREEGQIEFLLKAFPELFDAAVDIVRTGRTAKQYGLVATKTLLRSQLGLWQTLPDDSKNLFTSTWQVRIADIQMMLRERLASII